MREDIPAAGNPLAAFLDHVVGQSSIVAGDVGNLGESADPTPVTRQHHPLPTSEILGRLFQALLSNVPEMAFGTYTNPNPAVIWTETLEFRPDFVLAVNRSTAAIVAHVRGQPADSDVEYIAAAGYNAANGFTLAGNGFTVPVANANLVTAAEVVHWIAVGFGGAAT